MDFGLRGVSAVIAKSAMFVPSSQSAEFCCPMDVMGLTLALLLKPFSREEYGEILVRRILGAIGSLR